MPEKGVVVLAHGSREKSFKKEFSELTLMLQQNLRSVMVQKAHLRFGEPDFMTAVDILVDSGVETVLVVPLFVFPGKHILTDVPDLIGEAREKHTRIEFVQQGCLASGRDFSRLISARIREYLSR